MTLIETVVWIAVFTAAMLAISSALISFYRTNRYALEQATAVNSVQKGMDLMVRTIREASYAADGAYPVESIAANDFVLYSDFNTNPQVERIHFYLQGNQIYMGTKEPTGNPPGYPGAEVVSLVSDYVHNGDRGIAIFTYYDKNGAQINDYTRVADVRFVVLNEVADVNQANLPNQLLLRSSASLRNLVGK
jgi:type II secretory pathway pseudopilin PulG